MNGYESATKIQERFNISASALRVWANDGKIKFQRFTEIGKRYYCTEDVERILCASTRNLSRCSKPVAIYARVSSQKQKDDLVRQVNEIKDRYPEAEVYEDIASTLNYTGRKGLRMLLDKTIKGDISKVVILYKDRLDRFCYDLVEFIMSRFGVQIEVISNERDNSSGEINPQSELAEDVINVINYFVAKHNGRKAKKNKNRRLGFDINEDTSVSDSESEDTL